MEQRRPPKPERQAVDSKEFRDAMGYFATGITIISSVGPKGELIGVTANSFNSVSLEPPLVLFSLSRSALSWRSFLSTQYFAVNVLSRRQHALSTQFAKTSENKWKGVEHEFWQTGCPVIKDCLAAFECEIRYTHDGGDHIIFVGEVLRMKSNPEYRPLLFYRGQYRDLAEQDQDG
ncbi:MAG: flavin reductase family protein [Gammaproteobacteria bacterium]|nr:flavin reductase family protein [Gammaproteobacteria bacterium]